MAADERLTPLLKACWDDRLQHVKRLLAEGADPNEQTARNDLAAPAPLRAGYVIPSGGASALMIAARRAGLPVMRALVEAGADLEHADAQGDTALCDAVLGKDAAAKIRYLVGRGAQLERSHGFTPLYHAVLENDLPLARLLLSLGANVDGRIWTGDTPLIIAAKEGHDAMCKLLLSSGADCKARGEHQMTALHAAALGEHAGITAPRARRARARAAYTAITARLIAAGAEVEARNDDGNTPLIMAAHRGLHEAVDLLLVRGKAKVDAVGANDTTALLAATAMNQVQVVSRLLAHRATLDVTNADGQTPLTLAERNGYAELSRVLEAARGKTEGSDVRAIHALYAAGDYTTAWARYQALEGRAADDLTVLANSAYCAQQLGRHAEAIRCFSAALKREPRRAHLWRAVCYSFWALEDWEGLARAAKRAVALDARDAYAWLQLGVAHLSRDRFADAIAPLKKAYALDPSDAIAAFNLGWALAAAGKRGFLPYFEQSLRANAELVKELRGKPYASLRRRYPELQQLVRQYRP